MANAKHLLELLKGVDSWNSWRAKRRKTTPDLRFARLVGRNLSGADLSRSDLYGADLSRANLDSANCHRANLAEANLADTNLRFANLSRAIMTGVNAHGANFSLATVCWTILTDIDLSQATGLDSVTHNGPSSIGVDTLYRSRGKIPEKFLMGCGFPDSLIVYIPTLVNAEDVIQFYGCFISYSHKDEEFVSLLHSRLRDAGIRVWFAREDMNAGGKIEEQVDQAIRVYDKLLVVLSEHSLKSEYVKTEIRKAREHEREVGSRKLFPIRLVDMATLRQWKFFDADIGQDLANEVREYFIPNFSSWKDEISFERSFRRLLRALDQGQGERPTPQGLPGQ
jgi:hypothetical protein